MIVDKLLNELSDRLSENNLDFSFSKSVKDYVLDSAFDIHYGARPLKRFIQHHLESMIARKIVDDQLDTNTSYLMDYQNQQLIIKENA